MNYSELEPFFDGIPLIYLATATDSQPHVRAMALIQHNHNLWCCSPVSRTKVGQIRQNNKIEFCLLSQKDNQYHNLRAQGRAIEILNIEQRHELSQQIPFFLEYWESPDDPEFVLYHLEIDQIEYHPPGGKIYHILDVKNQSTQKFSKNFRRSGKT